MLITLFSAALASQGWSEEARMLIPDRITVELELGELGIPPESASYLGGTTHWKTDESGQTVPQHALRWLRLERSPLASDTTAPEQAERCIVATGHDPIPGQRQIHLYRSSLADKAEHTSAALGAQPGMVLASTDQGEVALVTLRPGDQVLHIDVEHNRSGRREEHLELRRGRRLLRLSRDGTSPRACYSTTE
jgi:hypothetical protein